jgi:basic amino acid/polyamine antiporter, APA family
VRAEAGKIDARLGTFDTAMVVVSLVVGIGIFRTPAIVARATGTPGLFLLAWGIGGLVSLVGALVFAELGSVHPRAGGYYRVVADCYHPALAFSLNWAQTLMQGAGAAGVAFIGAEYLAGLLLPPERRGGNSVLLVALVLMLVLLFLNALGIRIGAGTQNVLSMLKIVMIVGLAAAALALAAKAEGAAAAARAPAVPSAGLTGLAAALIPVFYAYGGYQMTMNLGADVRDARRRFPLAVAAGMLTVVGLYLVLNFAYVRTLGVGGVAESKLVAAALARASLGPAGEAVVSALIFLSAAGFVNATVLQMPRSYYAMAEDGVLPRVFLRVQPRTQVSMAGLLLFGATMLVPAFLLGSFEKLLNYVIFTDMLTLVVVSSTLFVLRQRGEGREGKDGAFRIPGFPVLPALYVLALFAVAAHVAFTEPRLALAGTAILLTGGPLFLLGRRLSRAPAIVAPGRP